MSNVEIERKFLIKKLPDNLSDYEHKEIVQGYLNRHPVVRVRRSGEKYYMTYKGAGLMERTEYNLPLDKESFEHLIKKADGTIIRKTRYIIPIENSELKIELDIFDYPAGLVLAEVEFSSVDEANAFVMPDWFSEDVTENPKYHNSNM